MAQKLSCIVKNLHGLHARPAALLVKTAKAFTSDVQIEKDGTVVNAKSIMSLMMLVAGYQSELIIHAAGADEVEAAQAIKKLIDSKFGEE